MKKTILFALLTMMTVFTQAQNLNKFFDKYAEDERFSYTKIGKNMQTLTLDINSSNKALAESIEKEVLEILKKEEFELEVASREKGERSYIYSRQKTNSNTGETVIINRDKSEINILWTIDKGKKGIFGIGDIIGLDQLNSLENLGSIQSLESLKNLEGLKSIENLEELKALKNLNVTKNLESKK